MHTLYVCDINCRCRPWRSSRGYHGMVRSSIVFVGLVVDIGTKFETTGVGTDEEGNTRGWSTFQHLTMYFMLTTVFVLQ